ncbi:endonuclease/exonuclease/phosphatase family protein [Candidatus Uabimicrobium sp. HlEnr_7]|uniref:endonuclease/exonuclease/phosphatase family protein n=1 Tax=Candidatus Uabimicrobium helgolandensis TaxID=3095367 RepID=UPI00355784D4
MKPKFQFLNVVKVFGSLFIAGWCLQFFARFFWMFELASHFAVQYTIVALFFCIAHAVYRKWKLLLWFSVVLLWQIFIVCSIFLPQEEPQSQQTDQMTMLHFNVLRSNNNYDEVIDFIKNTKADFVCLQEVTFEWEKACQELHELYPHRQGVSRGDSFGILFLSRHSFSYSKIEYFSRSSTPSIVVKINQQNQEFTIIATHPLPPRTADYSASRNEQLQALAKYIGVVKNPLVVVGDLNMTPWSPYFSDFINATGLKDSRQGFGNQSSWPSMSFLLWIPIDHLLLSPGGKVYKRTTMNNYGSDHYPIFTNFSLPINNKK